MRLVVEMDNGGSIVVLPGVDCDHWLHKGLEYDEGVLKDRVDMALRQAQECRSDDMHQLLDTDLEDLEAGRERPRW